MASPAPAHPGYIESRDEIQRRLRRISGQVGGIERMVAEERYCIDILTQVSAARAALDRVAIELIDDHTRHCVIGATEADREAKADELIAAVARLVAGR